MPAINRLTRPARPGEFADDSWKVFCSSREVRFVESEYAVPRASVEAVLVELRAWFERTREPVTFPVEVRFVAADDVWLSTAYERDSAYVAVHQYHRMDPRPLFAAFEAIVAEHAGRPHWGKVHTLGAERLRELYPRFDDFRAVRDRLDPGASSPTTTSATCWETEPCHGIRTAHRPSPSALVRRGGVVRAPRHLPRHPWPHGAVAPQAEPVGHPAAHHHGAPLLRGNRAADPRLRRGRAEP